MRLWGEGGALARPLYRVAGRAPIPRTGHARNSAPPPIASRLAHEDRRRRGAARGRGRRPRLRRSRSRGALSCRPGSRPAGRGASDPTRRGRRAEGRRGARDLHADGRLAAQRVGAVGLGKHARRRPDARPPPGSPRRRSTSAERAWPGSSRRTAARGDELGQAIVDGTVLGPYENARWKTEKEGARDRTPRPLRTGRQAAAEAAERERGRDLGERCRDVSTRPRTC